MWPTSEEWQLAFANFPGKIDCHYPSNKLLQFLKDTPLTFPGIMQSTPIPNAITIYTDGSNSDTAAIHPPNGIYSRHTYHSSTQRVELEAVLWVLELDPEHSLNIYTDSKYVFTVFHTIETTVISQATAEEIFHLFHKAQMALKWRNNLVYIRHLHAHTGLPGPLATGNAAVAAAARELPLTRFNLCFRISTLSCSTLSSVVPSKLLDS